MKTNRLKKVHENFNTEVWSFENQEQFKSFLQENDIEDRHDLADEVFALAHTLLIQDGFNWAEYGIVATGTDEGAQTYEIVTDENGQKVLTREDAFWGETFDRFIEKINRQLDAEADRSVDDVIQSYRNGNFTQAREQIAEILSQGRDIINEVLSEDRDRLETEFVLVQVARYLANTPSLEARQALIA